MISFTYAELSTFLASFIWPLSRILAFISSAPILSHRSIPTQVKIGFALLLTLIIVPTLQSLPLIDPGSEIGFLILMQQIVIGLAMGFAMRVIFVAIEMAGEIIGLQMGLGFAIFFDPVNSGQVQLIGRFLGLIALLVFLAIDGHLQMIAILAQSFSILPIGTVGMPSLSFSVLANWGSEIFLLGMKLSLPILTTLLIANLALGILTRAAPQLNIFAVGFPLTLAIGLAMMSLVLPYYLPILEQMFQNGLRIMLDIITPVTIEPTLAQ